MQVYCLESDVNRTVIIKLFTLLFNFMSYFFGTAVKILWLSVHFPRLFHRKALESVKSLAIFTICDLGEACFNFLARNAFNGNIQINI